MALATGLRDCRYDDENKRSLRLCERQTGEGKKKLSDEHVKGLGFQKVSL